MNHLIVCFFRRPSNSEADLLLLVGVQALWADEACVSLLRNNLDQEVFEHIKDLKSNGRGSLLENIKSGLDNHDFPVVRDQKLIYLHSINS